VTDAARAQIENGIGIQLADSGAVRAFNVVGVDFELGLGVNTRRVREQEILVGLVGVGFLRGLVYVDFAAEDALGFRGENALIEFVALTVGLGVFD